MKEDIYMCLVEPYPQPHRMLLAAAKTLCIPTCPYKTIHTFSSAVKKSTSDSRQRICILHGILLPWPPWHWPFHRPAFRRLPSHRKSAASQASLQRHATPTKDASRLSPVRTLASASVNLAEVTTLQGLATSALKVRAAPLIGTSCPCIPAHARC